MLCPAQMFNGTFLYNLVRELESRANPDLYTEQLLGRDSVIVGKFRKVCNAVCSLLPTDCFKSARGGAPGGKRGKRGRGAGKNDASSVHSSEGYHNRCTGAVSDDMDDPVSDDRI